MRAQVKLHKLLWVALSLLLMVAPLQSVQGQDVESSDAADSGAVVEQEADAVDAPLSEDLVAAPTGDLPYQTFLPVVGGSENGSEANNEAAAEVSPASINAIWVAEACTNVLAAEHGLWDDMPGAGVNNESGLFWHVTNSGFNETCSYHTSFSSRLANQLAFRVAVNDGAVFVVRVYGPNLFGACTVPKVAVATPAANAHSGFLTYNFFFATTTICRVQIVLTDNPDNVPSLRASALIDYTLLRRSGVLVWIEHFSRPF